MLTSYATIAVQGIVGKFGKKKKKSCSVAWSLGGRRHKLGTSEGSEGLSPVPSAKVKVDLMAF